MSSILLAILPLLVSAPEWQSHGHQKLVPRGPPAAAVARSYVSSLSDAARFGVAAEICGEVRGRNGRGVSATVLSYADNRCVAGTRADGRGRFCLKSAPGTYWLRARSAGTDVGYERVTVPSGSIRHDVQSVVEVVELPPIEVVPGRGGTDGRMRG